jgi:hypothetical protein
MESVCKFCKEKITYQGPNIGWVHDYCNKLYCIDCSKCRYKGTCYSTFEYKSDKYNHYLQCGNCGATCQIGGAIKIKIHFVEPDKIFE